MNTQKSSGTVLLVTEVEYQFYDRWVRRSGWDRSVRGRDVMFNVMTVEIAFTGMKQPGAIIGKGN